MPEISVVIPTYNRLDTLSYVLPTLLAQDLPVSEYELLVCDSNSTDGTAEYLAELQAAHPTVRHLPGAYSGRAAARNAGIMAARGAIVLFNDADILASPNLLSTHMRRHRERTGIAIVGLEVQVKDFAEYVFKRDRPEARGHLHPPSRKKLSWLYFLTGNASVRRTDLLRAGCFDESFTGYGHEDLELGYRLQRLGVDILYEPLRRELSLPSRRAMTIRRRRCDWPDGRPRVFIASTPHFEVMLKLGMTPLSLGAHSLLARLPLLLGYIDRRAESSRLARELVLQYHYVSGIKEARGER